MRKFRIITGLVSILLTVMLTITGCGSGASVKDSDTGSQSSVNMIKPDKFSLWTKGTQLRGANIYQRIIYPNEYDDPEVWGNGSLGPEYTQEDFNTLSAAGANIIVLSHPGLFDDRSPYELNTAVQDNLDKFISMAENADLFVVIAFRTGPGRSEFTFFGVGDDDAFGLAHLNDEVWKDKTAQDRWVEMWKYTAERYRDNPVVVGYELMVEPNSNGVWLDIYEPTDFYPAYDNTIYDWNQMYPRITSGIREVDMETPILIDSMSWSQVRWLPYLKPIEGNRIVYAVHQYEPQNQYTSQEADQSENFPNKYPGRFDTNWDGISEDFNREWINNLLSTIDIFKTEYGFPVSVTEYGVVRWEPGADRFLDDEMARFEASGMNYTVWLWQPASEAYNNVHNEFNIRSGNDPANAAEGASDIFDMLKKYWAKNTIRPSLFFR